MDVPEELTRAEQWDLFDRFRAEGDNPRDAYKRMLAAAIAHNAKIIDAQRAEIERLSAKLGIEPPALELEP